MKNLNAENGTLLNLINLYPNALLCNIIDSYF